MESNNDFTTGATNASGTDGMGASSTEPGMTEPKAAGLADRARGAMGTAGEKLSDAGSSLRERAGGAKDSLANALEAGAERLRSRNGDGTMAVAGAAGDSIAVSDDRMSQVTTKVAGGMDAASAWIRDADLDNLKGSIEQQVKDHPGRTLLIAVGVGYLLGKALRK